MTVSEATRRTAQGWHARAAAIETYAEELEHARRDAREAIVDAKEAKRRMNKAKIELADARRRLSDAISRAGQAQHQIAASAGSATPDPAAEQALRQAEDDADEAEQDIRHWQREYEDAEGEFERAVRRGGRAEERAEAAAGSARSALGGVDQAAPYWVPPSVPALKPLSGFAPDPPDVDEGFCDGGLGGVICDGGDFVGDVGYGLGQGGEELFTAATHPADTAEGLAYSATHPAATLDALANSCDGMSPGDCIGYIGAAAVGTKGAGKVATTARRGKANGDGGGAGPGSDSEPSRSGDSEGEMGPTAADRADARSGLYEKAGEAAGMAGLPMGGELGKIAGYLSYPEVRLGFTTYAGYGLARAQQILKRDLAILLSTGALHQGVRRGLPPDLVPLERLGDVE